MFIPFVCTKPVRNKPNAFTRINNSADCRYCAIRFILILLFRSESSYINYNIRDLYTVWIINNYLSRTVHFYSWSYWYIYFPTQRSGEYHSIFETSLCSLLPNSFSLITHLVQMIFINTPTAHQEKYIITPIRLIHFYSWSCW